MNWRGVLSTDTKRRQFEAENFFKLGQSFVRRDFLDKAEAAFQKAVNVDPQHALSWAYLSKIHEKHGRTKEAEECREKAVALNKKINFKKIGDECRLLEDRHSITMVVNQYHEDEMETVEFISFVENLSARSLALISNNPTSKDFFRSAVIKATMERTMAFEFQGLSSFLAPLNIMYARIVDVIELNFIRLLLTVEDIEHFIEFANFMHSRVSDSEDARKMASRLDLWVKLSKDYQPTTETSNDPFERAISLFNIIEKQKLRDEGKSLVAPLLNELVTFIITTSAEEKKGTKRLLSKLKVPIGRVIELFEPNIISSFLSLEKGKRVIELVTSLHNELTASKKAKKQIDRVKEWLRILNLLNKAMEKSFKEYSRIVNLLDVIEETNGEFQPKVIAEQSLKMIERDLVQVARKGYKSYLEMRVLHWELFDIKRIDKKAVRRWLDAIKRAYYKLHHMKENRELKLTGEERTRFEEIAEKMLRFLILSRKEDMIEKLANMEMRRFTDVDIFLPEEYLTFSIPAFRVMVGFLKEPYRVATEVELKNPRRKFNVGFWLLGLAITLTALPAHLLADTEYIDFIIPEYLKTLSLAMKENLLTLRGIHTLTNAHVTPQDVMVDIFK
ncbi:MAG: tetratricopeptide repeat protein, partial [Candidatus Thorarchaeota archaeon]